MSRIFGANWRTSISGIGAALFGLLTMIAALPYDMGALADIFPPAWKAKIAIAAALATLGLKWWNAIAQKDKTVTGGSVQQDLSGVPVPENQASLVQTTKNATPLENR